MKKAGSENFHALWGGVFHAVFGEPAGGFGASSAVEFFVVDENKGRFMLEIRGP
jgi:hypothetical protein